MHQLIGTPLDLNHYLDHPNELLSLLNRICKDGDLAISNSITPLPFWGLAQSFGERGTDP
jgi:hypothetical protein